MEYDIIFQQLNISLGNVKLNFKYLGSLGIYEMAGEYPYRAYYFNKDNGTAVTGASEFKTDSLHKGAVAVTFYDTNILAGTFWFDAVNENGQVIHVTDGRFDISQ